MKTVALVVFIFSIGLVSKAQSQTPIFGIAKESINISAEEKQEFAYTHFRKGDTIVFVSMGKKNCEVCVYFNTGFIKTKDLKKIYFNDSISKITNKLIGKYKSDAAEVCYFFERIAKEKVEKERKEREIAELKREQDKRNAEYERKRTEDERKRNEEKRNKKLEFTDLVIGVTIDSIELFVSSLCKSEDLWNYTTLGKTIFFLKDDNSSYKVLVDGTTSFIKKNDTTKLKLLDKDKNVEALNGLDLNHLQVLDFAELYKEYKELRKFEKELKAHRAVGLWVNDWSWSYSNEYTSNPEIEIEVSNLSGKTIKYITFYFRATNPVNDLVKTLSGSTLQKLRGIGPIEDEKGAKYEFETSYYSKVISNLQIHSIQVQYMDGSIKTYSGSLLDKVF